MESEQAQSFFTLEFEKLDGGKSLLKLNADLKETQDALLAFVEKYGAAAVKSKASVTLKITAICQDPLAKVFAVKIESTASQPKRPADLALAFIEHDPVSSAPVLSVRKFPTLATTIPTPLFPKETVGPGGEVIEGT